MPEPDANGSHQPGRVPARRRGAQVAKGRHDSGQAREQAMAFRALAEVPGHPAVLGRRQLAVQIRRHAIRRPAMVEPEAHLG